jgi:GT2 family glycosyltransferase
VPKSIEYINPNNHEVKLLGPDKKVQIVGPKERIVLSEYFMRYTPRKLRFVKNASPRRTSRANRNRIKQPKPRYRSIKKPRTPPATPGGAVPVNKQPTPKKRSGSSSARTSKRSYRRGRGRVISGGAVRRSGATWKSRTVGKSLVGGQKAYTKAAGESNVPISNNVGVGILSYNRFSSLKRLLNSIIAHTDLKHTTIFVSDESSNFTAQQVAWLKSLDIITLINKQRLGIAGNTNRLLRCLERFKYKFILNDDVEILADGWEDFYVSAMRQSGYHHFCFRQPGIYGATDDGVENIVNKVPIATIKSKPHGAIMAFDDEAFKAVGHFDESFGQYGMEHVDWSERVGAHFNQIGFHDVIGSDAYFKIHKEKSAVQDRIALLSQAKKKYAKLNGTRKYVSASKNTNVPSMSIVIPFRNTGRNDDLMTVVANMKAQRYPNLEIIIAEQDSKKQAPVNHIGPVKYIHVKNKSANQQFTKSMAFNRGFLVASYQKVILHDADIIAVGDYMQAMSNGLDTHSGIHLGRQVYYLNRSSTDRLNSTKKLLPNYNCERVVDYFEGGSLGCHKDLYFEIGGFNEEFIGYGVEDCCFYRRLKDLSKFLEKRTFKFFHLWHNRTDGWEHFHNKNRALYARYCKQYSNGRHDWPNSTSYAKYLKDSLKRSYKLP